MNAADRTKLETELLRFVSTLQFPPDWKVSFRRAGPGLVMVIGPRETGAKGQCEGMTVLGRRCRLEALPKEKYCAVHMPRPEDDD